MPAYHVERSVTIDAPLTKVRPAVSDFAEWPRWSPWLCMEPSATVTVQGTPDTVGHGYDWTGELVGAGGMTIAASSDTRLDMKLVFVKPFKSQANVTMLLETDGDQTTLTWQMDGKLPFFLFFMSNTMKAMIGADYQRGLRMLKEYVESGTVNASTEIVGVVDVSGMNYIGQETRCSMDQIGESMKQAMPAVMALADECDAEADGSPGAVYHQVDFKRNTCHYTTFIPTKSAVTRNGFRSGKTATGKAIKVVHRGGYQHLGNSWSAAMSYQRYRKHKPLKSQDSYELYLNSPENTAEGDLVTEIYVPIK